MATNKSSKTSDLSKIKMINTGCCISVEGDLVISEGVSKVRNKSKVKIINKK